MPTKKQARLKESSTKVASHQQQAGVRVIAYHHHDAHHRLSRQIVLSSSSSSQSSTVIKPCRYQAQSEHVSGQPVLGSHVWRCMHVVVWQQFVKVLSRQYNKKQRAWADQYSVHTAGGYSLNTADTAAITIEFGRKSIMMKDHTNPLGMYCGGQSFPLFSPSSSSSASAAAASSLSAAPTTVRGRRREARKFA